MSSNQELCNVLLQWLQTFQSNDRKFSSVDDLTDGVVMAQILHQIAPEWFSTNWLSKIKFDAGDNWRLKVSNLKKIIEAVSDYYQEYVNQNINLARPDAVLIGEHKDILETVKLLQLILGCAVNCNKKQEYIKQIMLMEESVQNVIMQLIQELETLLGSTPTSFCSNLNPNADTPVNQLFAELQTMTEAKERLALKCVDLENHISALQEERQIANDEKKQLEERLEKTVNNLCRDNVLRKQIDSLKEEIFKLETVRDDYRLKLEMQEKEMEELQIKFDSLQQTAAEARHLKDEVDILREDADRAAKLESAVKSYKKKLEELSELKREMRLLEEKNLTYVQQTLELEEELKKANTWKTQAEMYRKQIVELRNSLSEETKKLDKIEFENAQNQEKLGALQKEKERLVLERDSLKEANEELFCSKLQLKENSTDNAVVDGSGDPGLVSNNIVSVIELKRELVKLQHENTILKINRKQSDDEKLPLLQAMFDDTSQQNKQLRNECRVANQRILQLEAELKDVQENKTPTLSQTLKELNDQLQLEKGLRLSESAEKDRLVLELKHLKSILFDALAHKDQEYEELEEKYRKCLEKARCVAKSLEYNELLSAEENDLLRHKITNRSDLVGAIEKHFKQAQVSKEMEEKLIISAFFNLAQRKQQESVDQRLLVTNSAAGNPFLVKQRQSAIRRIPLTFNPK